MAKSRLDNPEIQTAVKHYVRAAGVLTDAWLVAGYKDRTAFYNYLKKHPVFHQELNDIKYFSDPAVNVELIKRAHKAVQDNLTVGAVKTIVDLDRETGKPVPTRKIMSGPSKWAIEMILKAPTMTEAALKMVLASLIYELSRSSLSDAVKAEFYKFLDEFKRKQLVELIQRGCAVKEDVDA
jgi:hypothetical protein